MNKILIIGIFNLVLIYSCSQKNNSKNNVPISIEKARMIRYQEDSMVLGSRQDLFLQNLGRLMDLPQIKNGKEDLYIRIWLWGGEKSYVINIAKGNQINECQIIEFNSLIKDGIEYIVIHRELRNLIPKSGWQNFFASMENFQISKLESQTKQSEKRLVLTEASYIQFEIAEPNHYRFYEYLEPLYYQRVDRNAKMVYNFLKYFNNEMGVDIY